MPAGGWVVVCGGPDCAKDRRADHRALLAELAGCDVVRTSCLDVCKGPVAVVQPPKGDRVVVVKVRSRKARRAVRRLATERGAGTDDLRVRRRGRDVRKALRKAKRAVERS